MQNKGLQKRISPGNYYDTVLYVRLGGSKSYRYEYVPTQVEG
jgi:hypothetical protein